MTIQGVSSAQSSAATGGASGSAASKAAATDPLAQESTFLKLLVEQIKNQDPLNPTDGLQFVTQLAQFSELEQITNLTSDISGIKTDIEAALPAASSGSSTTGTTSK